MGEGWWGWGCSGALPCHSRLLGVGTDTQHMAPSCHALCSAEIVSLPAREGTAVPTPHTNGGRGATFTVVGPFCRRYLRPCAPSALVCAINSAP